LISKGLSRTFRISSSLFCFASDFLQRIELELLAEKAKAVRADIANDVDEDGSLLPSMTTTANPAPRLYRPF